MDFNKSLLKQIKIHLIKGADRDFTRALIF